MWLFNRPPLKQLQQRYSFTPPPEWLERLQKSSIRVNVGGSASFVSAAGLILTNHHVALDCLQKLSTATRNYASNGYVAKTRADEVKCVDLETNVLMSIEDVTQRVNAAVSPGMDLAEAQKARRAVMNTIEKESLDKTGLRSDVVTLYQGAEYHLYRYKKYTDIRLVFAPEANIAFFGGDPDNFEFPRYDLDVCFFRAYEDGKPAKIDHYLRVEPNGINDGDLIFLSGHPGGTSRLNTLAHLRFLRDVQNPFTLDLLRRREILVSTFSERSVENARRASDGLFAIANSRKAYIGLLEGLHDPAMIRTKAESEAALRARVASDQELQSSSGHAWPAIENSLKTDRAIFVEWSLLEGGSAFNSRLFRIARVLVRLAEEKKKPNPERLREYRESNLESVEQQLYSEAPIYTDLETAKLANSLGHFVEALGAEDPLVQQILDGKSPMNRASELIRDTKLMDVALRKRLGEGGAAVVDASDDPMIKLARLVEPRSRKLRKIHEDEVQEPLRQAYAKIANATFHASGEETYPDATFTLRLAFGTVKSYEDSGRHVPWRTTIGGAFERAAEHKNQPPFDLPESWLMSNAKLKLATPMNFVSTVDSIGGNSGSPAVNRDGNLVGVYFDFNQQSLRWDYLFDDRQGRSICVDIRAVLEALRTVYKADKLVSELLAK